MPLPQNARTIINYCLIFLGSSVLLVLLFTGLVYYLAVSDQERVPALIEEVTREELGAAAAFDHYRFQYFDHFPFLSLSLRNLTLRDSAFAQHRRELLRIKEIDLVFQPWQMLQGEIALRNLVVDSARLQLYKTPWGYTNTRFLGASREGGLPDSAKAALADMKGIQINGLFFDYLDSVRQKHHRFELRDARLAFRVQGRDLRASLEGQAFVHGLTFKPHNGPFMEQQNARLNLAFNFPEQGNALELLPPSALVVGEDRITVSGRLQPGEPGFLHLEIRAPAITLERGKAIVAPNIQKALSKYQIEGPLPVEVIIDGETVPGQPTPLQVNVQAQGLELKTPQLQFSDAHLSAAFKNDCDTAAIITPETGCLEIKVDSALLFGALPVQFTYFNANLNAPDVQISGALRTPLAELNGYMPQQLLQLEAGALALRFGLKGIAKDLVDSTNTRPRVELWGEGQLSAGQLHHLTSGLRIGRINSAFSFDEQDLQIHRLTAATREVPVELRGSVRGLVSAAFGKPAALWADLALQTDEVNLSRFLETYDFSAAAALNADTAGTQSNLARAIGQLSSQFQGDVAVQANALQYQELYATDVAFRAALRQRCAGNTPCIRVEQLRLTAYGAVPLTGTARLSQWGSPQLQFNLTANTSLAQLQPIMPEGLLRLQEGGFRMELNYQGGLRPYAKLSQAVLDAGLYGQVRLDSAALAYLPQGYNFQQVNARIRFDQKHLYLDTLSLLLNGNSAWATGQVDDLLPFIFGKNQPRLHTFLSIQSPSIDLNTIDFKQRAGSKPRVEGMVGQTIAAALEKVQGRLHIRSDTLQYRDLRLSEVYLESHFLTDCERPGGCVHVDTLEALWFGNSPMRARLKVWQLHDPVLWADVKVRMPLQELNRMFAPGQLRFRSGEAQVDFQYEGQPHRHVDVQEALLRADLRGQGHIQQGGFTFVPRGYRFDSLNTDFSFDGADLHFDALSLRLNSNRMEGSGTICAFLPFLFFPDQTLKASLEVYSPLFNINRFRAPQKFQEVRGGRAERPTAITRLVNAGLSSIEADFNMRLDTVVYRDFRAKGVQGRVEMGKGRVRFDQTQMQLADGTFRLSGEVTGLEDNQPNLDIHAQLDSTDVQAAFVAFDNFGQTALRHQNLSGRLHADLQFKARANANYELDTNSLQGVFDLRLSNGTLRNLPALDSVRNLLFVGRDLSHIDFATLENTFRLDGQLLDIGRMEVRSSALTFSVGGQYHLGQGNGTDLLLEIPLANLFRRGLSRSALENIDKELSGPDLLLRLLPEKEGPGLRLKWVLSRD